TIATTHAAIGAILPAKVRNLDDGAYEYIGTESLFGRLSCPLVESQLRRIPGLEHLGRRRALFVHQRQIRDRRDGSQTISTGVNTVGKVGASRCDCFTTVPSPLPSPQGEGKVTADRPELTTKGVRLRVFPSAVGEMDEDPFAFTQPSVLPLPRGE